MQVSKQQLEQGIEEQAGSNRKWSRSRLYCHPAYLIYMHNTSWEALGCMKYKLESSLHWEISINTNMQMTPPLWQKKTEDLKVSWWKWKRAWKNDLKFNIQETKIMVSGPITSWQIDREKMLDLIYFVGRWWVQITADGECSHEIKRCFLFERKFMSNLHCPLKSRDITLPTNVCLVKAIFSPVVIYECDSCTI